MREKERVCALDFATRFALPVPRRCEITQDGTPVSSTSFLEWCDHFVPLELINSIVPCISLCTPLIYILYVTRDIILLNEIHLNSFLLKILREIFFSSSSSFFFLSFYESP